MHHSEFYFILTIFLIIVIHLLAMFSQLITFNLFPTFEPFYFSLIIYLVTYLSFKHLIPRHVLSFHLTFFLLLLFPKHFKILYL